MLLLFTAGVMNLFWVAALAVLVLAKRFYRISEQPPCSVARGCGGTGRTGVGCVRAVRVGGCYEGVTAPARVAAPRRAPPGVDPHMAGHLPWGFKAHMGGCDRAIGKRPKGSMD